MKEFLLIFRNTPPTGDIMPTPEQLKDISKPWMDWIGSIAAQDKLANRGNRLTFGGATVKTGAVTDGPYAEIKEIILGYSIVKVGTLEEAIELAKGCPVLPDGGNVEVREIAPMNP
jgi:YCII-related domain